MIGFVGGIMVGVVIWALVEAMITRPDKDREHVLLLSGCMLARALRNPLSTPRDVSRALHAWDALMEDEGR